MTNMENGRVTTAILGEKLDNVIQLLESHIGDEKDRYYDHEKRIRLLAENQTIIKERQNVLTGLQGLISVVLSSIATYIGIRN